MVHSQPSPWWKTSAFYHIYPRSFYDSNGDGFGDLRGITDKLHYLSDLGIGAIWMGPVYPSPQVDNGYDISDYRDIDPRFGTLDEMDSLIEEAHRLGIRVLMDLVFNHSSDRHRWFTESKRDPDGPYGSYYIWRDAADDGGPPNNWRSFFSIPAWTWSPERNQYYLHMFAPEQPDLNWENDALRRELADTANFWIDRGIDGFRMDVINVIAKRTGLPSLPVTPTTSPAAYCIDEPLVAPYLREFRSRLHHGEEIVLVGETPAVSPTAAREYTDPDNRALDMLLLFDHVSLDHGEKGRWDPVQWRPSALRDVSEKWHAILADGRWPANYLSNHDQPRIVSRYGDDQEHRFRSATALATAMYLQRGTPIIYQGDEIAMRNFPLASAEELVDIESRNAYLDLVRRGMASADAFQRVRSVARDNARTPMQWSPAPNGGFSVHEAATPWFPTNPDYTEWNVEAQRTDDDSVLAYFRTLLKIRRETPALLEGTEEFFVYGEDSPILAFQRTRNGQTVRVIANLGGEQTALLAPENGRVLLSNVARSRNGTAQTDGESLPLEPWEALVLDVTPGL